MTTRCQLLMHLMTLSATMKELHGKFVKLHPEISYAAFCKCRPFWIVYPSVTSRNTCLCVKCSNFEFLVKKLHTLKIIKENSSIKLLQEICCLTDDERCLFRTCNACANKLVCYEDFDSDEESAYTQWRTVKEQYVDSKGYSKSAQKIKAVEIPCKNGDIVNLFEASLPKYMSHQANKTHQYTALKLLKETLTDKEAILHIDFSENYACKYDEEVQSLHFGGSRQQITLHTGVIYSRVEGEVKSESFCTMSDSLNHGPPAIWAHLDPIMKLIGSKFPEVDVLHFMSDGPATQYRNKTMFHIITNHLASSYLQLKSVTWNFSEAGHGKGAPDGIGGTVKRTADRLVAMGESIPNFGKFVELMKKSFHNITLYAISKEDIAKKEQILNEDTTVVLPLLGTMKVHQLSWHKSTQSISFRTLSCFACKAGEECEHYHLATRQTTGKAVTEPEALPVESDVGVAAGLIDDFNVSGVAPIGVLTASDEELTVGTWVAAKYDGVIYPGVITEISEDVITVSVMVASGTNKFKWPSTPDICAYPREDICRKIGNPTPCNHRMREFVFDEFP